MISITIPRNVTEIGGFAFYSCKALTSVTIQEGVTRIGAMAFGDCRALTSVTIPQSVMEIGQWEQWLNSLDINWPQFLEKAGSYLTSGVGNIFSSAVSIVSSVGGVVMQFIIAFIFALYLLAGKERLAGQFRSLAEVYLKEKTYQRLMYLLSTANDTFSKFFIGQFTEAIVIGVLCTLGNSFLAFLSASTDTYRQPSGVFRTYQN